MKFFFLFAPFFHAVPLAVTRQLYTNPGANEFAGLATGSRSVFESVSAVDAPPISPLYWLDDLEREWLARPSDTKRLADYEEKLGSETIRQLITSDRQIGGSLVFDTKSVETPLMAASYDTENVKRYVVGLLDWAFGMLTEQRPDLVFCYTVAGAPAFALSIVSRFMGIPFARISSAHVDSKYAIENAIELRLEPVNRKFFQALNDRKILAHAIPDARDYLSRFRSSPTKYQASADTHARIVKSLSLLNIAKQAYIDMRATASSFARGSREELRRPATWRRSLDRLCTSLRARRCCESPYFRTVGQLPTKPFAYVPLQVSPEASTMVLAPMNTNQMVMIESLVKSLPLGMELVVKEHIPMLGKRPDGFYRRLSNMPGVALASPFEDTFSLTSNAALVCTVTGTAAWEAIKLGTPALVIGQPHFLALGQGVVHCSDVTCLPNAVKEALNMAPIDNDRLELYVAAIMDQCFDLPSCLYRTGVTDELVKQNPDVITLIATGLLGLLENHPENKSVCA